MNITNKVFVESIGSIDFDNPLSLLQQEEGKMQALVDRISGHPDVQKALAGQGNGAWSFDVSAIDGVVAHIGNESITVILPEQLLRKDKSLLDFTKTLETRAQRQNLVLQEREDTICTIFEQTWKQRKEAEGIGKEPPIKKTLADRVSQIKEHASKLVKVSSLVEKVMKLAEKVASVVQGFGESGSVLSNQMNANQQHKPSQGIDSKKVGLGVGYAMSGLDVLGSAISLHEACIDLRSAYRHENREGQALYSAAVLTSVGGLVSGSTGIAKAIAQSAHAVEVVQSITPVLAPIGFISNGISLVSKAYSLGRTAQFRSEMNEILDRKDVSEEEKCREFLVFLEQKLTLSAFEINYITEKAKNEGKDPEKEITQVLERKWDRFGVRTGQKDAWTIAKALRSNEWIDASGNLKLKEVKELITAVSRANFLEVGSFVFRIFLLLLSVAALILAVVLPTSHATTFFYIFSAVVSLVEATQGIWADKLPRLLHFMSPRCFPCKGTEGALGRLTWKIRQAVCSRFYSDRIDTVDLPWEKLKISKIISGLNGGTPPTPSTPTFATS